MPGIYWYIAVGVIGIAAAAYTFFRKKNTAQLIAFYLFATMVSYIGEVLVLVFFGSYTYKPGVFADSFKENIIGHMIPNSTLWPATAIFVASFALRYRWIFVISLFYVLLDILFVYLGIYEHHWWRTWMTAVAIFSFCTIVKNWYILQNNKRFCILRYVMFAFILWDIIFSPTLIPLLADRQLYNVGLYASKYKDSAVFSFVYHAGLAFIGVYFICILHKWTWKLVPFAVIITGDILLFLFGILSFSGGWNLYLLILLRIATFALFIALENRYSYHTTLPPTDRPCHN